MHHLNKRPVRIALSVALLSIVFGCDRNEPIDVAPAPTVPSVPSPTVPPLPDPKITSTPPQPQPMPGQNNDHSSPAFKGGPTDATR